MPEHLGTVDVKSCSTVADLIMEARSSFSKEDPVSSRYVCRFSVESNLVRYYECFCFFLNFFLDQLFFIFVTESH